MPSFRHSGPLLVAFAFLAGCPSEGPVQTVPQIAFDKPSVDFGAVVPGMQAAKELRVSNTGNGNLLIAGVRIDGGTRNAFAVENVPNELVVGAAATVLVRFATAAAASTDTASLIFVSNSGGVAETETVVALVGATLAPTCDDGVQNGPETDRDCGGGCPGCPASGRCGSNDDCDASVTCFNGVCTGCTETTQCRAGQLCKEGRCEGCATAADCRPGQACQAGLCTDCPNEGEPIDTTRDPRHCGACGNVCPAPLHAAAACRASVCARMPCESGWFDLDGATTSGCEAECVGTRCTTPSGVVTLSDPPLPEAGLSFQGPVAGGSVASAVQTSNRFSNVGTTAPAQAPAPVTQSAGSWRNTGGFGSQFGR